MALKVRRVAPGQRTKPIELRLYFALRFLEHDGVLRARPDGSARTELPVFIHE